MHYPFAHLSFYQQQRFFPILLVLTLLVMSILTWMGRPLVKAGAIIVDFELAGTLQKAQTIMHAWGICHCRLGVDVHADCWFDLDCSTAEVNR